MQPERPAPVKARMRLTAENLPTPDRPNELHSAQENNEGGETPRGTTTGPYESPAYLSSLLCWLAFFYPIFPYYAPPPL